MSELAHYDLNEAWTVEARIEVDGVLTDPTTIAATARKPDGTLVSYAFPGPNITKDEVGVYTISAASDQAGVWYVEVVTTGPGEGRQRHSFVVDPRWPADLLAPYALTTIEAAELILDRVGTQGSSGLEEDDKRWIAKLINAFSREIHRFTDRQFLPTEEAVVKVFVYDGSGALSLAPYEASTITSVVLYSDRPAEDQVELVAGYSSEPHYYAEPRNGSPEGTYLYLDELPELARETQITVTGNWGAGVVPEDVAYICEAEVANAHWRSRARAPIDTDPADSYLGPDVGPFKLSRRSEASLEDYANRERVW